MGFLADDIRRLATALRTNSISTLTTHLLELSNMPPVISSAVSGTALDSAVEGVTAIPEQTCSSAVDTTAVAENTTTSETNTNGDAIGDIDVGGDVDNTSSTAAVDAEHSMDIPDTSEQPSINLNSDIGDGSPVEAITSSEFSFTITKPLPLIPRLPSEKMLRGKAVLQQILQKVLSMVPSSCLRLIERGIVRSGGEWGIEVSSANQVQLVSLMMP
jgi:hypothetical protein